MKFEPRSWTFRTAVAEQNLSSPTCSASHWRPSDRRRIFHDWRPLKRNDTWSLSVGIRGAGARFFARHYKEKHDARFVGKGLSGVDDRRVRDQRCGAGEGLRYR